MNDPGLESPISDEVRNMESRERSDERDVVEEDEQAFLAPRCVFLTAFVGLEKSICFPQWHLSYREHITDS